MTGREKTRLDAPRVKRIWPHKLWLKLFQARRAARRLQRQLDRAIEQHRREAVKQQDRYEEIIEIERARFNEMQFEWSNRFVQLAGQAPIMRTDLPNRITDPKHRVSEGEGNPTDVLGAESLERFLDAKDRFWTEGIEQGFSPAAIKERWQEVEESVIEDSL